MSYVLVSIIIVVDGRGWVEWGLLETCCRVQKKSEVKLVSIHFVLIRMPYIVCHRYL